MKKLLIICLIGSLSGCATWEAMEKAEKQTELKRVEEKCRAMAKITELSFGLRKDGVSFEKAAVGTHTTEARIYIGQAYNYPIDTPVKQITDDSYRVCMMTEPTGEAARSRYFYDYHDQSYRYKRR